MSSRTSTSLFGVIGAGADDDQDVSRDDNPRVFLDISINGGRPERMIIELFANIVPKTAENFRLLCTGTKGIGPHTKKPLHYKGTVFQNIHPRLLAEGGDLLGKIDGTGGESIYGKHFKDESFQLRHSEPGMLSMGNKGPDTNGSRFFISFRPISMLDGFNVVFGKVIEGTSTIRRIEQLGTPGQVKITDCGEAFEDKGIRNIYWVKPSSSEEPVKEQEKQSGYPQSEAGDETSQGKTINLMDEPDQGIMNKSLKRAGSSDEQLNEGVKRSRYSSSEGLLQVTDGGAAISEIQKNNGMESYQDRQQIGDDTIMDIRQQQLDWAIASVRKIAQVVGVYLPDYPSPHPQID
ncbi:putative peptidylprolyl isomerase [Helianthus annuus]|nr:putative peptidylprolyl isomerase [Helianthus annuus]